ncbi:interleukin-17 receptor B isoform X2 [Hoplias malabaricus]|uniref:interleukin-17 receptor B isoform X2 n=1 Tax=Hoplias malabaricus TaxID=27720 RepID=UPI00346279FD
MVSTETFMSVWRQSVLVTLITFHCRTMKLLLNIMNLLFLSILHLSAAEITFKRNAICTKREDIEPEEWSKVYPSNPSSLNDLRFKLNLQNGLASSSLNISWSINIDSSIQFITGTWIELFRRSHSKSDNVKYRCDYQPSFTSNAGNYSGLEQLWFHFQSTDTNIEPSGVYTIFAYNLPTPSSNSGRKSLHKTVEAPGCDDEQMKSHKACLYKDTIITAVSEEDNKVLVTIESSPDSEEYDIILQREYEKLDRLIVKTDGKPEVFKETLNYSGTCEKLQIWVKPKYKFCGDVCKRVKYDINCIKKQELSTKQVFTEQELNTLKPDNTNLLLSIGCAGVIVVLLMLICFYQLWKRRTRCCFSKSELTSISPGPVGVLVVYPAVNSVFQKVVMALADFLQSHKGLNVVIDMWQRGTLAEQGPLRWFNSQADQADKVLFILPPQHTDTGISTDTDCHKPSVMPDIPNYTVPASANELFSLALNLAASSVHDPQRNHKFWVVQLGQEKERRVVPMELRGCKSLSLPRDLDRLHHKLASRQEECSRLSYPKWLFHYRETSKKVREALVQLDRSCSNGFNEEMLHLTEVECKH